MTFLIGFMVYLLGGFPILAYALPQGGQIVAGQGNIQMPSHNDMVVNQSTGQMIANWQGFSVAAPESVTFNQPNASAVALNRVVGVDPSVILGKLSSNGQIFLTNPSGIIF
ncbi:MAG: filamentous hemagglutinin N-terminal domain-containing protein, partial [Nitrospinales bacterium]